MAAPARSSRATAAAVALSAVLASCSGESAPVPGGGPTCPLPSAASLSVVQATPPDDATGVFVNASVSLRFNTCLDPSTVTAGNFWLSRLGTLVPRTLSYDPVTATVTMRPSASLAYGAGYSVTVFGAKGARGETMTSFSSYFVTQAAPEYVPPTTAAVPPGGRYKDPPLVELRCADNPGGTGCAATYYTLNGDAPTPLSARYVDPFAVVTTATLRFFSVDVQGNAETPRQEEYVIDQVPPTLVGSDPADAATSVPVNAILTAGFSEEMDPASLTSASVTVEGGATATLSYEPATSTLSIAPTERLACATTYQVHVGPGATDVAGNALVQPATFAFTTHPDCLAPATSASVPGGLHRSAQQVTLSCADAGGSGCARIVYTTDGTAPRLEAPANGTVVAGASAGPIAIGAGDTVLRWFAEDAAGNREVLREQVYSVSETGFTFVATDDGLARGVGPVPARFVPIRPGGRTYAFFRDPSNGRLYRGTERGLLCSDGGEAWTFLTRDVGSVISVLAQGSKIYAGAYGGLWVSTDGGATFAQRDLGAPGATWVGAVIASGRHVYVATSAGVAVSADRGQTFAMRTTAHGLGSSTVRGLVLDGSTLYAATAAGVSISADGAETFTNHAAGLASPSVTSIAVSGSTVYAGTEAGLFVSTDGGQSFVERATTSNGGLGSNFVGTLALEGGTLYLGTGVPWVSGADRSLAISVDGGESFTFPLVAPATDAMLRVETIFVEGTTVRVGAYPAYYLSTDGGSTFAPKDLRGAVVRIAGEGTSLVLAISDGSGHGGVAVSTDGGLSFTVSGEDAGLASNSVADVFAAGSNVYAATFSGVGFSADGGVTFVNHDTFTAANSGCVYASGTTVWVCGNGAIEKSVDEGPFAAVQAGTGGGNDIAVSGSNFYVSTTSGLLVSNAGGDGPYTLVGAGNTRGLGNTSLSGVAVDSAGRVLAASSSSGGPYGVYVSEDAGASFTAIGDDTIWPRGVHAHGTTWYAASYDGLAISVDGGATWERRGPADGIQAATNHAWFMP